MHLVDVVDSDQWVVDRDLSLCSGKVFVFEACGVGIWDCSLRSWICSSEVRVEGSGCRICSPIGRATELQELGLGCESRTSSMTMSVMGRGSTVWD